MRKPFSDTNHLKIVCSSIILGDIVENLSQGVAEVRIINGTPGSPDEVSYGQSDLELLRHCDLFIRFDRDTEPWTDSFISLANRADLPVYTINNGSRRIAPDITVLAEFVPDNPPRSTAVHGFAQTLDPFIVLGWIGTLTERLIHCSPNRAELILKNAQSYSQRISQLHKKYTENISRLSLSNYFAIGDTMRYLSDRYNFHCLRAVYPPDTTDDIQTFITALAEQMNQKHCSVLIVPPYCSARFMRLLKKQKSFSVICIDCFGDYHSIQRDSYLNIMEHNLRSLVQVFQ